MRNRGRLDNGEQIQTEESETSALVRACTAAIAEITARTEPTIIDTSRRLSSTVIIANRICQAEL
jgi:hypothetical protein